MGESNLPPKGYVGGSILPQPSNRVKMKVYMGGGLPEHKIQKGGYKKDSLTFRGIPYADINFDNESFLYKIIFHIVKARDETSMKIEENEGELIIPVIVNEEKNIVTLHNSKIKIENLFLFDEIDIDILIREGQYFTIGTLSFDKEETFVIPTRLDELSKIPVISGSSSSPEMPEDEITEEQETPNIHKLAYGFSVRWIEQPGLDKKCVTREELTKKPIPESFTPGERAVFDSLGFDTSFIKKHINDPDNIEKFLDFWTLYLNRDGTNNFVLMYSRPMRDYIQGIKDIYTKFLQDNVLSFLRKTNNPSRINTSTQPFDEKDYYFFEEKSSAPAPTPTPTPAPTPAPIEETTLTQAPVLGGEMQKITYIINSLTDKEGVINKIGKLLLTITSYDQLIKDEKTIVDYHKKFTDTSEEVLELKEKAYNLYEELGVEDNKTKTSELNKKLEDINRILGKTYYTYKKDKDFSLAEEYEDIEDDEDDENDDEDDDYLSKTRYSPTHKQQIIDIPYIKVARELVEKIKPRHDSYFELFEGILNLANGDKGKSSPGYHDSDDNISYISALVNIYKLFLNYNKDTIKNDVYKEVCKVWNPTDIDFLNGTDNVTKTLGKFREKFKVTKGGFRKTRSLRKRRVSPKRKRT